MKRQLPDGSTIATYLNSLVSLGDSLKYRGYFGRTLFITFVMEVIYDTEYKRNWFYITDGLLYNSLLCLKVEWFIIIGPDSGIVPIYIHSA